jgi:hypothetical protein
LAVKPVSAIAAAVTVAAVVLTATASTAGAAHRTPHHFLGLVPHHLRHAVRARPAHRTTKAVSFNCVSACSDYEATINQYFTDVAAASAANATDNVYSVATQYSGIQYSETFAANKNSFVDGDPFPTTKTCHDGFDSYCVTDAQLQKEIARVIKAHHWPTLSLTSLYFIFTPANVGVCEGAGAANVNTNQCTTNSFCAYHFSSNSFIYAVQPDAAASIGDACATGEAPAGNNADDTISTVSHEQNEAITDPFGDAWVANDGPLDKHGNPTPQDEIGDLCAYDFGTALGGSAGAQWNQVIDGHNYWLQLEYSNQDSGCVPYLGGPVTAPVLNDGSGPLVLQQAGASVMTTHTVYAIYWVPAAPVNRKPPQVSGTAMVGKKLTASTGTWSNGPTFTYRWLRCTSKGTSCQPIAKATTSKHVLVAADAGHRLEVQVTATNMVGSLSAISAPSGLVKK